MYYFPLNDESLKRGFFFLTDKLEVFNQFRFDPAWDSYGIHPIRVMCCLCEMHLFFPCELPKRCVGCELEEALPYLML